MTAQELAEKVFNRLEWFDPKPILQKLVDGGANEGAIEDYQNVNGCMNYMFMAALVDVVKPKQVVELGGAMGVGTLCLAEYLPKHSNLYSITLEEHGLEFAYIKDRPKNMHLIVGDDRDMKNWEGVNLKDTDVWYIDTGIASDHFGELLKQELELYSPYFKKGAIVMFDDIHLNKGMNEVWNSISWDRVDLTDPCHFSGWGLAIV